MGSPASALKVSPNLHLDFHSGILIDLSLQTLFIPALISLAIYLLISYALIPFIRRYRERYSQYLPLHNISAHTSSLRERVSNGVMRFVLRINFHRRRVEGQGEDADSDEGEEMGAPRGVLGLRRNGDGGSDDTGTRLSRELEQGFMDDSDNDEETQRGILGRRNGNA